MVTIRRANITFHGGPEDGMTLLVGHEPIALGRRPYNDVVIDHPTVSRVHARIQETPLGYVLRDLGSANGTYVNGKDVGVTPHLLRSGDSVTLADSRVALNFDHQPISTVVLRPELVATPA